MTAHMREDSSFPTRTECVRHVPKVLIIAGAMTAVLASVLIVVVLLLKFFALGGPTYVGGTLFVAHLFWQSGIFWLLLIPPILLGAGAVAHLIVRGTRF